MLRVTALSDKIIMQPVNESEIVSRNFIIPDIGKEKAQLARVIAIGDGFYNPYHNSFIPLKVKVNDLVLVPKIGATSFLLDGDEYYVCREVDLLAIVNKQDNE